CAMDGDGAAGGLVEARYQVYQSGLARAAGADKRNHLPLLGCKADAAKNRDRVVREVNLIKSDLTRKLWQFPGPLGVAFLLRQVEVGEHMGRGALSLLKLLIDRAHTLHGFIGFEEGVDKSKKQ